MEREPYPPLFEKNTNYNTEIQRRLYAALLRRIKAVEYAIKNNKIKEIPDAIKDPKDMLAQRYEEKRYKKYEEIRNKNASFYESMLNGTEKIFEGKTLQELFERLPFDQMIYVIPAGNILPELQRGEPSFMICKDKNGNLTLAEEWSGYEGQQFDINVTLSDEQIITKVAQILDYRYSSQQISYLEKNQKEETNQRANPKLINPKLED